jgi:hypothetical protein
MGTAVRIAERDGIPSRYPYICKFTYKIKFEVHAHQLAADRVSGSKERLVQKRIRRISRVKLSQNWDCRHERYMQSDPRVYRPTSFSVSCVQFLQNTSFE